MALRSSSLVITYLSVSTKQTANRVSNVINSKYTIDNVGFSVTVLAKDEVNVL